MNYRVTGLGLVTALLFAAVAIWLLRKLRAADTIADASLIGKTGDVTRAIGAGGVPGSIRIEGRDWIARSDERIDAGGFGEVVGIDGASVKVVKVPALSSHTTGYHMMEM